MVRAAWKARRARQHTQGMPLRWARTPLATMCSCVVFENSLQKSRGCVWPREAPAINMIRGRERGPSRDNRVCENSTASSRWRGVGPRPGGGKTIGAERVRVRPVLAPPHTRQASQGVGRRNAPHRRKSCPIAQSRGLHGSRGGTI